jgi:3-isopropylmalate/(R)-2-methylmalate dehydratase small subunit
MIIKGKVHKFGDDINTDDIIAAKYLVTTDEKELGSHCMENISADFIKSVRQGDIIVAGKNFGCGSSREHAPLAIKGCGITAVIAKSFAGIFFRNAINIGLPFLESDIVNEVTDGDLLEIDLSNGRIHNISNNKVYHTQAFPSFLQDIVKQGGLINYVKGKKAGKNV